MKRKPLFLTMAALLAAAGFVLGWVAWRRHASLSSTIEAGIEMPGATDTSGEMRKSPGPHAPPDPNRKYRELTPEQRVKQARQGPVGG